MTYQLSDTHCHITSDELYERIEDVLKEARLHHVTRFLAICTNFKEYERAQKLKDQGQPIDIALGFHPNDLYSFNEEDYARLETLLKQERLIAIGEIGLDYHWDDVKKEDQKIGFLRQIRLAELYQKPILIHMREATLDTINLLKEHPLCHGIMHCYSGSYETARILINLGYYIAYGGPLTFKNSRGAPQTAAKLPVDKLFIETDSPYLTPHPYRGRVNEPKYLDVTFQKLCEIKGMEEEALAIQLEKNYQNLFMSSMDRGVLAGKEEIE